jgi:arylsulfatase A-like enzyme
MGSLAMRALAVAAALSLLGCAQSSGPPTGVILISIDTLRPDHLGCYGYGPPTSPRLDALCRESVVFEQARAHAPSTLLSHASLFTSLVPQHHGASHVRRLPIRADRPTLAEVYRRAGWRTAGFVGGGQLAAEFGFGRGFEIYAVRTRPLSGVVPDALRWLDGLSGADPFFLFLHTFQVHHPYEPAAATLRELEPRYDGSLPPAISIELLAAANEGRLALDDADRRHIVAAYDAEIREMDAGLGGLLDALSRRGLLDRSVLVFTSDHGEELGEHGFMGWHSHTLYEELLRVPLVVRMPGGRTAPGRVAEPVQLVDLAPTLLAATAVPVPDRYEGLSLLPLLGSPAGDEAADLRRRLRARPLVALAENEILRLEAILAGRWKLAGEQLFDLQRDPGERVDLAVPGKERVVHLRALLAESTAGSPPPSAPVTPNAETESALRALGYVSSGRQE